MKYALNLILFILFCTPVREEISDREAHVNKTGFITSDIYQHKCLLTLNRMDSLNTCKEKIAIEFFNLHNKKYKTDKSLEKTDHEPFRIFVEGYIIYENQSVEQPYFIYRIEKKSLSKNIVNF